MQAGCSRIVLADEDETTLRQTELACRAIDQTGLQLFVKRCNSLDPGNLEALMIRVVEEFGSLDYCANCLRPPVTTRSRTADTFGTGHEQSKIDSQAWQRRVYQSSQIMLIG